MSLVFLARLGDPGMKRNRPQDRGAMPSGRPIADLASLTMPQASVCGFNCQTANASPALLLDRGAGDACLPLPFPPPPRGVKRRDGAPASLAITGSRAFSSTGGGTLRSAPRRPGEGRLRRTALRWRSFCEPGHAFGMLSRRRQPAPGRETCIPRVGPRNAGGASDEFAAPGPHSAPSSRRLMRMPLSERNGNTVDRLISYVKEYYLNLSTRSLAAPPTFNHVVDFPAAHIHIQPHG
jgi:hypothetical protein